MPNAATIALDERPQQHAWVGPERIRVGRVGVGQEQVERRHDVFPFARQHGKHDCFLAVEILMLFHSYFLGITGLLVLGAYMAMAKLYWFIRPLQGISLALICYIAGFALAIWR